MDKPCLGGNEYTLAGTVSSYENLTRYHVQRYIKVISWKAQNARLRSLSKVNQHTNALQEYYPRSNIKDQLAGGQVECEREPKFAKHM